jgi:hypothetical protein
MCNGLFTSNRPLDRVFEEELAYLVSFGGALGTPSGGEYFIDYDRRAVGVGDAGDIPWPNGDQITPAPLPPGVDPVALQAVSEVPATSPEPPGHGH